MRSDHFGWVPVRPLLVLGLVLALVAGAALGLRIGIGSGQTHEGELRLLVDDELTDTQPLLDSFAQRTGIDLLAEFAPTTEIVRRLSEASFTRTYDGVWLASTGGQRLPAAIDDKLTGGTAVMSSPLVLGVRTEAAARLTRKDNTLTWQDVARESAAGRFEFGMACPRNDNGAALLGIATGLADEPDVLSSTDVYEVAPQLRVMREHHTLEAMESTEVMRQFRSPQAGGVDGVIVHESQILKVNDKVNTASRLNVLVPGGRAVFVSYQLRGASDASAQALSDLHRLADHLLSAASQQWLSDNTFRRPVATNGTDPIGTLQPIRAVETPRFPGLLDRLVDVYLGSYRYPSRIAFVVDVSGSMHGQEMQDLRHTLASLTGDVATRRDADVEVLLIPFAATPQSTQRFVLSAKDPSPGISLLDAAFSRLRPGGNTAIFDALIRADADLEALAGEGNEAVTSIVLVTDGENTAGTDLVAFLRHRQALKTDGSSAQATSPGWAQIFPVLVGGADSSSMLRLAMVTGGTVHDARKVDLTRLLLDVAATH